MTYEKELADLRKRGVRAQIVREFSALDRVRDEFIVGHNGFRLPFLIVVGQPGTSKSHHFEKTKHARYINNAASPVGLYAAVWYAKASHETYEARKAGTEDDPIILDDVDGLLAEKGATSLFKALGSDRPVKHMNWVKQNTWLDSLGIPQSYETSSRLCILCNTLPKVSKDLQAVFDRAKTVVFSPTATEIHSYVGTWWHRSDRDIYDFIGQSLARISEPSIRWYTDTRREKMLGNNWREWLVRTWYDDNPMLSVVAEIKGDRQQCPTFNSQAAEFQRRTGKCRASYNLYLQKWKERRGRLRTGSDTLRGA